MARDRPAAESVDPLIDRFLDALWLEDGLSANTLSAYRRDLTLFALSLPSRGLVTVTESDLQAYFAARHAETRATTANRRLTVFRRFFRWAVREGLLPADPRSEEHTSELQSH